MRYERNSRRRGHPDSQTDTLARALGVFSITLGAIELLAPGLLTRRFGMEGSEGLIRAYGAREIANGIGLLAAEDPTPWMWARVGGDALDLATLATGLEGDNRHKGNVLIAIAAVGGVAALDAYCATTLSGQSRTPLPPPRDYGGRVGFPRPPEAMRGAASDFEVPADYRIPDALRPWTGA